MTTAAKLSSALLIAVALIPACGGDPPPAPAKIVSAPDETGTAVVANDGVPKITADEAVYDFGTIKATDSVEHVFTIRNAGDADLKVERVQKT
jgi:hypothetical protein